MIVLDEKYIDALKDIYWQKRLATRDIRQRAMDHLIGKPLNAVAYGLPKIDKVEEKAGSNRKWA